jgi:hypothetical protein
LYTSVLINENEAISLGLLTITASYAAGDAAAEWETIALGWKERARAVQKAFMECEADE